MFRAEGHAVLEVVSAVGPELPFDEMVCINGRGAADDALPAVPRKYGLPEVVPQEKFRHIFPQPSYRPWRCPGGPYPGRSGMAWDEGLCCLGRGPRRSAGTC